jgi:radical SAM superfamily enzyme YgiQ (UPF0313 family)
MHLSESIRYDEPLFRPPGEANSAIIQATIGCSWNKCAFCEMYTSKKFRLKKFDELKNEIKVIARHYQGVKKIFLADGNAFVLSADKLLPILNEINSGFGKTQRISSYALPNDIIGKTDAELLQIRDAGLKLLYVGVESGDDELLKLIDKSETYQSTKDGILKAHNAGIDTSVMILNGLGGKKYSKQHAINTARLISEIKPKFLSSLTLSLPFGEAHYCGRFKGEYEQQTIAELAEELMLFIENCETENTIFRSDHVSNHLVLKGILSRDKDELLNTIRRVLKENDLNVYPEAPPFL